MASDFDLFTHSQLEAHGLKEANGTFYYAERERTDSIFVPPAQQTAYYSLTPEKMKVTVNGEQVRVDVNMKYSHLLAQQIRQLLPQVRVHKDYEKEVEICWTLNPCSNSCERIKMFFGEDFITEIDCRGQDSAEEIFQKRNYDQVQINAGNVPQLIEWSTILPAKSVFFTPRWSWFNGGTTSALPLFLLRKTQIHFDIQRRDNISKLLRMRRRRKFANGEKPKNEDDIWEEIVYDSSYIQVDSEELRSPDVMGLYNNSLEDETTNMIKRYSDCVGPNTSKAIEYPFESLTIMDKTDVFTFGQTAQFTPKIDFTAKSIIVTAQNVDALSHNYYSNYTTNASDAFRGFHPISKITLVNEKTSKSIVYDSMTLDWLASLLLPCPPRILGHRVVPRSAGLVDITDRNGTSLGHNQVRVDVELNDTSVYQNLKPKANYRFCLALRIQTTRKLVFRYNMETKTFDYKLE